MAKNYTSKISLEPLEDQPRKVVLDRIMAFSKAYSKKKKKNSALDLLKNQTTSCTLLEPIYVQWFE